MLTVRAQDAAGNESPTPLTDEVATLDLTAPLWTGAEVSVDDLTPSSVRLQWSASEDNSGQLSYLIYLNDRLRARVEHPTLSAAIDLLTPNTTYVTRIEAIDGHGNRAVSTLNVTFTTLDESPPEWVENARLSLVSAGDHSIELAWEPAIDDVAVVRYEIRDQNESLYAVPGDEH